MFGKKKQKEGKGKDKNEKASASGKDDDASRARRKFEMRMEHGLTHERDERALATARRMLERGSSIEEIMEYTGLSKSDVEGLQE